jgi:RND family efflux transporter MFP subunit
VAAADVDAKEREVLTQRQSVQNLENSMNLVPAERKSLQAAIAVKQTSLKQAEIDLEKTTISAPFDCRLGELSIEVGQFLTAGETLFEALSTAVTEIDAQVAPHEARKLIDSATTPSLPEVVNAEAIRERASQLGVTIRLRSGDVSAEWKGRFERLREELDTQTRMLGIVVAVDKPYEKVIPGRRPALLRGMFCEVELRGKVREGRIVIPRSSLHDGHVYVLNAEKRLHRRPVEIDFAQANFVCLRSGLNSGDTVVVSDPTPAIEGMLVDPVEDVELLQTLIREASGEGVSE